MERMRWRLVIACLAVIGSAIAIAGGSAANRDGVATLEAVPGPGSVTYGQKISYKATFTNNNVDSGAVFTQTTFVMSPPLLPGGAPVTPVVSSCGAFDAGGVLTCSFGQLRPGDTVTVAVTWSVPGDPSKLPGCAVDEVAGIHCLAATGRWSIKEGKPTNGNETFDVAADASLIGVSSDDTVNRDKRAGGFETAGFTPTQCGAGASSLSTNQSVTSDNPVATSFCLPAFQTTRVLQGLASTIVEGPRTGGLGHPYLGQSTICVAEFGQNCGPDGTYDPHDFGTTNPITVTILVLDSALLSGDSITQLIHNGEALPPCLDKSTKPATDNSANPNGCVVSITRSGGPVKVWTLVGKAKTNGPWGW